MNYDYSLDLLGLIIMGNILLFGSFSVRDWDLFRQRQQALVDFLIKDFDVFYVERINAKGVGIITIFKALLKRFILVRNTRQKNRIFKERLHFIQLIIFPFKNRIFRSLNARLAFVQVKKIMRKHNIEVFDSILISHPTSYVNDVVDKIPARKRIYDCVQRFEFHKDLPAEISINDKNITKKSDVVIADSITIFEDKKKLNKNVIRIPQGVDLINYNIDRINSAGIPSDLVNLGNYRVCYVGGFHQSFDFDLAAKVAKDIPECTVVLLGKETSEAKKKMNIRNVVFLGWKHYTILPMYMKQMDVFIIPYILNEQGKGVFPTKLFEYLYFKKPVVSTALPDILEYEKYLYVAHTAEEFIKYVQNSLFDGENKLSTIPDAHFDRFISENSWEARYKEFKKYL